MSEGIEGTGRRALLLLTAVTAALMLSSTMALAITKGCEAEVECVGTKNADILNGSDASDLIYGRGGADTLKGFGGIDAMYGQGRADKLFGGPDGDYLVGGPGQDTLSGGADYDLYFFGDGWGKESINDGATPANTVVFENGPSKGEQVPVSDDLTITLVAGEGPEVETESGTSTLNWESNVIKDVHGGSGDDRITGNHLGNQITASGGADTIFAGAGDDTINVLDSAGGDVVDCGESFVGSDTDTVYYDSGDQIADDCEEKIGL